jgi:LEA14-like dessication related protein
MNNTSKVLLAIGSGLGAFALGRYVYKSLYLASLWDFEVISIRHTSILPRLDGILEFAIINKSAVRLEMRNLDLKVITSGIQIGQISQDSNLNIAPNGRTTISIKIGVEYKALIKALGATYRSVKSFSDFPIDVRGTIDVKGVFGYIALPIRYTTSGQELYDEYGKNILK